MEGELIAVTFVSSIFGLMGIMMLQHNWFKRENFKFQKSNIMAENRLKLRKMEKELGLSGNKGMSNTSAPSGNILDQLKGLDLDKIQGLLSLIQKPSEEYETEDNPLGQILKNVPPEVIQGFLKGLNKGGSEGGEGTVYQE